MDALVGEWKQSELLRETAELELVALKSTVRYVSSSSHRPISQY